MKQRIERNIDKLGKVIVIMFMIFLFFVNIVTKILKFIRGIYRFILRYGLNIIISFYIIISLLMIWMSEPKVNKPFLPEDKAKIERFIDGKGKDIIIIVDLFENKSEYTGEIHSHKSHGDKVFNEFLDYIKLELKKEELDVLPILLSFDLEKYSSNELRLQVKKKTRFFEHLTKEGYSLEEYIKFIREKNPNSKIVLSSSFYKPGYNEVAIELSKKYDLKLAQAYFNDYFINKWMTLIQFYFLFNKTNTLIVHNGDLVPLLYNVKKVSYLDIDIYKKHIKEQLMKSWGKDLYSKYTKEQIENKNYIHMKLRMYLFYRATSYHTPVLAYEYYLNPDSNLKRK